MYVKKIKKNKRNKMIKKIIFIKYKDNFSVLA